MTTAPEPSTAPVTAEGLREKVAAAIEARVKASVLPERPPYDGLIGLAHFVGASFHDLADAALAALAGDPGDLPARMAEAIAEKFTLPKLGKATEETDWEEPVLDTLADRVDKGMAVFFTAGDGGLSFRSPTPREVAEVALSVRSEVHAATVAENAAIRRKLEDAEGELSSRVEQHQRAVTRAIAAEGEVARLRAGESDERPVPGTALTPAQWIRKWNDAAPDRRLHAAKRVLEVIDQESQCFQQDHGGRLEHLEAEQKALVQQRDSYADTIAHQITLHRARRGHDDLNRRGCQTCPEFTRLAADPHIAAAQQRQMAALAKAFKRECEETQARVTEAPPSHADPDIIGNHEDPKAAARDRAAAEEILRKQQERP